MIANFDIENLKAFLKDFYTAVGIRISVFNDEFELVTEYPETAPEISVQPLTPLYYFRENKPIIYENSYPHSAAALQLWRDTTDMGPAADSAPYGPRA